MSISDWSSDVCSSDLMEVPAADPRASEKAKKREESVSINERAARFYAKRPAPDQGAAREPRHYLSGRGISDAMSDRFGIGFAPGSKIGEPSPLMRALDGVDPKDAEQLGLVKRNPDSGNVYDFFRRRIIIPIHDARGGVIGFGGR